MWEEAGDRTPVLPRTQSTLLEGAGRSLPQLVGRGPADSGETGSSLLSGMVPVSPMQGFYTQKSLGVEINPEGKHHIQTIYLSGNLAPASRPLARW